MQQQESINKDKTIESNSQIISESTKFLPSYEIKREDTRNVINSLLAQNSDRQESSDILKSHIYELKKDENIVKDNIRATPESNFDYKEFYKNQKRFERNTV
jgi:hypothetical protein